MDNIKKYIFLGFGELVLDKIYDEKHDLLKENGGCPVFNVLYNLGLSGEKAYAVGGVGNDENGNKAIASLHQGFVNTENVEILDKKTNVNHIIVPKIITNDNSVQIKQTSPLTGETIFKLSDKLNTHLPERVQNENIILVVSNFQKTTFEFIKDLKSNCKNCKVAMDIGNIMFFKDLPQEYISEFLSNINIIQMNQNCISELYKKLDVSSNKEFFNTLNLDLLTVTMGHEGANYIYRTYNQVNEKHKTPVKIAPMLDPTGAGDAFFSMMLKSYRKNMSRGKTIDDEFVDNAFTLANGFSRQVVGLIGARGDLRTLEQLMNEMKTSEKTLDYFYGR